MSKTKSEIKKEIKALRELQPRLPRFNYFNENIHAKLAVQIEVLSSGLSEDDVYNRSADGEEENPELWPEHIRESALHAVHWRDCEEPESPSSGWEVVANSKFAKDALRCGNRK